MLSWLLIAGWIHPCYSHALYAYTTERTIQVGAQDPTTGKIHYSNCNSKDIPIFPLDKPNILDAKETPRNGTALAAQGWWDFGQETIIASIFWQTKDDAIVNGYYTCNMKTGKLVRNGEYRISETAEVDSIRNESGLAVDLLGADNGYRVFYHNKYNNVMMLHYTQYTDWTDGGFVSQDNATGMALGSAHIDKENITVAFPKDSDDIEISRLEKAGQWRLESFPTELGASFTNDSTSLTPPISVKPPSFHLPAWNSSLETLGSAIDRTRKRSIFYIGNDKKLYEVAAKKETWEIGSNQTSKAWPIADEPGSGLAVAYNQPDGKAWVYYWSNETIVQTYRNYDGDWEDAKALPQEEPRKTNNTSKPIEDNTPHSSGLSTGAKAGIGVGVGVGALLVGVLVWLWMKRRNRKKASGSEMGVSPTDSHFTEAKKDPTEMDGHGRPAELYNEPPVYELQGQHVRE
ncbi:hypothetical protein FSPOR_6369 [Fusarium sporotrichioides]|uniref:Fucose-specific lectin n=1 Tax=Fusarium sporotrichioides TaxID=5514 RepID=A0A395S348_FUSSP|nr:hypothetical protein FSPOR_6369 [Fusarium sporotrichioides]